MSSSRGRDVLRRLFDRLRLVALLYDIRERARYLMDRERRGQNARFAGRSPDGLPLPPPPLVHSVAGHFDLQEYYDSGRVHARLLRHVLADNGFEIEGFGSLLDFGCGCGRVIRHWHELPSTDVRGSDYNPRLVDWCRRALPFADFRVNDLVPPLPYGSGELDFIYAISVFTHLTEELQRPWMRELERVLAPGGALIITTKGRSRLASLDHKEQSRFERGELVVQAGRYAGRNLCAAFHPEHYVRDRLAGDLITLDFVPATEEAELTQDLCLMQRPSDR